MKSTILRYGIYSAITIFGLFLIGWFIGKALDLGFAGQEVVGYTTIVLSLSFVFFGIKHFRDKQNDGVVSFGKALTIGLLISLFAALAFGLIDVIYRYLNPNFVAEYYAYQTSQLETTLSGAELEAALSDMEAQREMFSSTFMSFLLMSLTVFVIGIIVSLISSLILQRK
ncbi:MAG: DUF4199 domain-containing protein [Bacteroidota bacterium]